MTHFSFLKRFVLENGRLCYRKDSKTTDTKGNIDMMLSTVKSVGTKGRAFTFEVLMGMKALALDNSLSLFS
jgi:hypothetical protein